jgi:hypothetical protein
MKQRYLYQKSNSQNRLPNSKPKSSDSVLKLSCRGFPGFLTDPDYTIGLAPEEAA